MTEDQWTERDGGDASGHRYVPAASRPRDGGANARAAGELVDHARRGPCDERRPRRTSIAGPSTCCHTSPGRPRRTATGHCQAPCGGPLRQPCGSILACLVAD